MAVKAILTFKQSIPYMAEHKLVTQRGFHVFSRLNGGGVILHKGFPDKPTSKELPWADDENETDDPIKTVHDIPSWRTARMEKDCENIYNSFMDPYRQVQQIADEIGQMCVRLRYSAVETEWAENWVYSNVI